MKEYSIKVPDGMATTVLLSDEDAKRAGLLSDSGTVAKSADPTKQPDLTAGQQAEAQSRLEAEAKAAAEAQTKQLTPENK